MSNLLPKSQVECKLCHDRIGLFQPYYTVNIHAHYVKPLRDFSEQTILCPDCFHAYENFLVQHETQMNHQKNYQDIKNV